MRATNTAGYDAPIGLTADPVVFTLVEGRLSVLLARRLEEPQRGMFALPGGFVGTDEAPEQTAELQEEFHFYVWDEHTGEVRWMCAWDTAEADVDAFAAAIVRVATAS